ncbi:MAG TPA: arabinofuranosyltransferase [Natronosporangium sp.]
MAQGTVTVDSEPTVEAPPPPRRRLLRLGAARPLLFTAGAAALVVLAGVPSYNPAGPRTEYLLRTAVVGLVAIGAVGWWWAARRGRDWGADLAPAILGAITGLSLVSSLNGTSYAMGGLEGDQTFRTAAITRFADTWQNADFTFRGLPSFYAPAYFWVLGRTADLTGTEPWRMAKVGAVAAAILVPLITYLLWRRLVPAPTAALLAAVPLVVDNAYEPYAWLVIVAIVPWWLAAVAGLHRPDAKPIHPVYLGLIGGVLFLTYYYFFFIAAIALAGWLVVEGVRGRLRRRQLRRSAAVLAIAAAVAAVYWLPLLVSVLRAEHPESLANRWFHGGHADLPLPMFTPSVTGAIALLGLGYLVWTVREPLSRGLLVFLAAAYGWYLLGALAAAADTPLLSFRGKPLIPLILLTAGGLALVRLAALAARRFPAADVRRVGWVLAAALVVFAGQQFLTTIRDSPHTETAQAAALPDDRLSRIIDDRYRGTGNPVVLSDRVDLLAVNPYYGFLQWNAHYAHPAAEFHERVRFLTELAGVGDPAEFADRSANNRFDRIDVLVLRDDGDELVYRFSDDAFPAGQRAVEIRFPRSLFAGFQLVDAGEHVVAIRR